MSVSGSKSNEQMAQIMIDVYTLQIVFIETTTDKYAIKLSEVVL